MPHGATPCPRIGPSMPGARERHRGQRLGLGLGLRVWTMAGGREGALNWLDAGSEAAWHSRPGRPWEERGRGAEGGNTELGSGFSDRGSARSSWGSTAPWWSGVEQTGERTAPPLMMVAKLGLCSWTLGLEMVRCVEPPCPAVSKAFVHIDF